MANPTHKKIISAIEAGKKPLEVKLYDDFIRSNERYVRATASYLRRTDKVNVDKYVGLYEKDLNRLIVKSHKRTVKVAKGITTALFIKRATKAEYDFDGLVEAYIIENGLRNSSLIAVTSKDRLAFVIERMVAEGKSTQAIARELYKTTGDIAKYQALTIAVTEVGNAYSFADSESIREAEVEHDIKFKKYWIEVEDARTRKSHRTAGKGEPILMKDKFIVGSSLMDRPNDPSAPAEEVVGCRCVVGYEELDNR